MAETEITVQVFGGVKGVINKLKCLGLSLGNDYSVKKVYLKFLKENV